MQKTIFPALTLLLVLATTGNLTFAQEGAISPKMLEEIQTSLKMDNYARSMQNAVTNNEIDKLALNRELAGKIDYHFAHTIKTPGITDQKSSGRCWLFTALNVLRPKVVAKYNLKDFEFSQNYLFFWDQFEKANLFLEAVIQTRSRKFDDREVDWLFEHPIQDGGVWTMMPSLLEKYGLVPAEIMPESLNSENTKTMRTLLKRKLREQGMTLRRMNDEGKNYKALEKEKAAMLAEIYRILVISLGTPPDEFEWRYTDKDDKLLNAGTFTPLKFFRTVVDFDLGAYVMLMNDPSREYNRLYEIQYDRNLFDSPNWTFINLPAEDLKRYAKASILADEPMYFSCDVGKQLDSERGFLALNLHDYEAVFGVPFAMDKEQRILTYDSGSSHGMALVGVDTSASGAPTKWLLENSWGEDKGHKGFLVMTDEWFGEYAFRLVILKQFLPEDVLAILKQTPEQLPPWDRMF